MRGQGVVLVAVVALGGGLLLAPPAAGGPVHELQTLTVTPATVSVSGFAALPVTVTATVRADDVISGCPMDVSQFGGGLAAWMTRVGPAPQGVVTPWQLPLRLVAGTNAQGTWQGTWDVPSTDGGIWAVDRLIGCTEAGSMTNQVLFDVRPARVGLLRTVVVTASRVPTLTLTRTPAVAPYGASQLIRWTFRNGSGTRLAGRKIKVGTDTSCGFYSWGFLTGTLDANGSFAVNRSLANLSGPGDRCVILTTKADGSGVVMLSDRSLNRWYFKNVTAKPVSASLRLGGATRVTGRVAPRYGSAMKGPKVDLQRYQRGHWLAYAATSVALNGTYTLRIEPSSRGTWWFRVVAVPGPDDRELARTPTKAFSVTVR